MTAKRSLKLHLITAKQFNDHFVLDSPGYFIAKEAKDAGEVSTPLEILEILCLANQLYANLLFTRMLLELKPYGKAAEYLEKRDTEEVGDFVVGILGKKETELIMREVMADVRRECGIGTGKNEKAAPKRQAARR